jgi:hypothetical protein
MKSRVFVAFAATLALAPLNAHSASNPNPALATILAAPPASDYAELPSSQLNGSFGARDWANLSGDSSTAIETEATLNRDGFVDGFGKAWQQSSALASPPHGLVEAVMAFTGGRGANSALTSMEASDKSDSGYRNADTVSGISRYYGAHFVRPSSQGVEDLFAFVKGNDLFAIAFFSSRDDVLADATRQIEAQYNSAPGSTIPRSEWPENANPVTSLPVALFTAGIGLIVVVVGVLALVLLRRRSPAPTIYASFAPPLSTQLSPDGKFWWDGAKWQDATLSVPPGAQVSSDGAYWWDGKAWRAMPAPPPVS